jgi:hypothetical protein
LIIFGSRTFTFKKGIAKEAYQCESCGIYTRWELCNLWEVFTLFFIPLIPYWKRAWLLCQNCDAGIKLTKKNRNEVLESIEIELV